MSRLTANRARCDECGDVIESRHRHDFVSCTCGTLYVDGGLSYTRRGSSGSWTELSEFEDET